MIHLQGLGIVGGFLAWHLHARGVPFTWDDNDSPTVAWRASTGAIYPSGESFDAHNYSLWEGWAAGAAPWMQHIGAHVETTSWWYCTKTQPHGAKHGVAAALKGDGEVVLKRSVKPSFHFNGQTFVPATQSFFKDKRTRGPAGTSRLVITHGFGPRWHHSVWGWTRLVQLDVSKLTSPGEPMRPSIYFRRGRFVMAYAYAVPGTDYWYAGSHLIVQKRMKSLIIPPKYEQWRRNFEALGGGLVRVVGEGVIIEGWRPAGDPSDLALVREIDNALVLKPFWHSGIRHAPLTMRAALEALEVT